MSIHKKSVVISPEEYLEGEKFSSVKHEYVDGHVYAMVGTSKAHNLIAINFLSALREHLRGSPCQVFIAEIKVHVAAANAFFYPDVLVACDDADGHEYYSDRPVLIIEVLSDSTQARDSLEKRIAYQSLPSLQEYLLVAQHKKEVSIYRRSIEGWDLEVCSPGDRVDLVSVDLTIELETLYEDVSL